MLDGIEKYYTPPYNIHLKRSLRPFSPQLIEKELTFKLGDIEVAGRMIYPSGFQTPMTCAIMIPGRGCGGKADLMERPNVLARYGMATVTFVPVKENVAGFKNLFVEVDKSNYRIVILPVTGHNMEHGNLVQYFGYHRSTRSYPYYFKFDRVAPGVFDEIITFPKEHDFLP